MSSSFDTPPSSSSLASDKSVRSELVSALDLDCELPSVPRTGEESFCCSAEDVPAFAAPRFGSVLAGIAGSFSSFIDFEDMMSAIGESVPRWRERCQRRHRWESKATCDKLELTTV